MHSIYLELKSIADRLNLFYESYTADDAIYHRLLKIIPNSLWVKMPLLGLESARLINCGKVIVIGSSKCLSNQRINFIDSFLEPYIQLLRQDLSHKELIHDIRTPLSILKNLERFSSEKKELYMEEIINLTEVLLKKENGSNVFLHEIISKIILAYNKISDIIIFENRVCDTDVIVNNNLDYYRLFSNIISNAVKYSPKNNILATFRIINNEWFFSIHNNYDLNDKPEGFGLGINIIKRICDKNKIIFTEQISSSTWKVTLRRSLSI